MVLFLFEVKWMHETAPILSVLFSESGRTRTRCIKTPLEYRMPPTPGALASHCLPPPLVFPLSMNFASLNVFSMCPCCYWYQLFAPLLLIVHPGSMLWFRSCFAHGPRAVLIWDSWELSCCELLVPVSLRACASHKYREVGLFGQRVCVWFYKKLPDLFPKWLNCFTHPPAMQKSSGRSTSSPAFGAVTHSADVLVGSAGCVCTDVSLWL